LSNLTGDAKYKEAYRDCIRYHFEHYQAPGGLLNMGYHRFIDLRKDTHDGDGHPPGFAHELKMNIPYYELFWEADPKAARKMIEGIWNSHMQNWSNLEFDRHAGYGAKPPDNVWDREFDEKNRGGILPGSRLTFYDTACDMIVAAGMLSKFTGDEKPLTWARRLLGRYVHSAHPKTGLPPYEHTRRGNRPQQQDFPKNATEPTMLVPYFGDGAGPPNTIFAYGAVAMMRLGDELGEKGRFFSESVHKYLKAYARHAYNAEDNTLRPVLCDGTDMTDYVIKKGGYFGPKGKTYQPFKAHPGFLLSYAL
jgi:pectate lyase